jgi:hypothetical protein
MSWVMAAVTNVAVTAKQACLLENLIKLFNKEML